MYSPPCRGNSAVRTATLPSTSRATTTEASRIAPRWDVSVMARERSRLPSSHRDGDSLGHPAPDLTYRTRLNGRPRPAAGARTAPGLRPCAASFRSSAMWAAIDGRRYDDAKGHMREAQALAEMSGDQAIKFRIWSHTGTMYRHMGRPADALAANDVARNLHITRRDPLFASLGLARQSAICGAAQDRTGTRRAFEQAQDAMLRADPADFRPVWMLAFYDQAELDSLALSAFLALGDYQTAEFHAHRCLSALRPHMRRSLAITTTRLAHAQLSQGAADAATVTAMSVSSNAATQHARVSRMLQEFGAALRATAPGSSTAQIWTEHTRDAWRTPA
ncbi:hypothetical protein [Streptomyces sp. NPDC059092]|uniref:hypothetical protein n=1 Tax=Streptomyces sp. NPDC059092 TaxID=3346725 RepID=UPI003697458D